MKPMTQKILLAVLAVVSIGTTGLVLLKGAIEQSSYEEHPTAATDSHGHDHSQHGPTAAIIKNTESQKADDFGPAPAFALVNQNGVPMTLDTFKGQAVITSFIFTRCQGPCPLISAQMSLISQKLAQGPYADKVKLVSFSVDPEFDTPPVLKEYAQRFEANTARWSFLTGSREDIWKLVGKGFMLALQNQPDDKTSPILHTTKLVLIDPQGHVRGHYDALDENSRQLMFSHLAQVLAGKPKATNQSTAGQTGQADQAGHSDHSGHAH